MNSSVLLHNFVILTTSLLTHIPIYACMLYIKFEYEHNLRSNAFDLSYFRPLPESYIIKYVHTKFFQEYIPAT